MGPRGHSYTLPVCALLAAALLAGCPGTLNHATHADAGVPWSYPEASLPSADTGPAPDLAPQEQTWPDSGVADQLLLADLPVVGDSRLVDQLPAADQEATADQGSVGKWYQANKKDCTTHCSGLGKQSAAGPEGAHCMSGEVRSASGIAQGITFTYGCWSSCAPQGPHTATSKGEYCYRPGQKQDDDDTDRTVGCFCE